MRKTFFERPRCGGNEFSRAPMRRRRFPLRAGGFPQWKRRIRICVFYRTNFSMFSTCSDWCQAPHSRLFSLASERGGLFHRKVEMRSVRFSRLLESPYGFSENSFSQGKKRIRISMFIEYILACFSRPQELIPVEAHASAMTSPFFASCAASCSSFPDNSFSQGGNRIRIGIFIEYISACFRSV